MTEAPDHCLSDFEGTYRLTRQITHADALPASFTGSALWAPHGGGLSYVETGVLSIQGHPPMNAQRRYFWASDLKVYFEDGRFFHQVPPSGGSTSHQCDPDHYTATYQFDDWPDFRVIWQVTGPAKEYRMVSRYVRLPDG